MKSVMTINNVLEIVQKLPLQDREECVHILSRRIVEDKRKKLALEIHKAEGECKAGMAKQATVTEIMKEILS